MAARDSSARGIALKTSGYVISTLSVLLLGFAAWEGASKHPLTLAALVMGVIASIIGMACRWWTYFCEHRKALTKTASEPR